MEFPKSLTRKNLFYYSSIFILVFTIPVNLLFLNHTNENSASWTHICSIQGKGLTSPYEGKYVTTRATVYADQDDSSMRGFYLQEIDCDENPSTSDGIFVYIGERTNIVSIGDRVEVEGLVAEYYGKTEIQASPLKVKILSTGNPIPEPINMTPPFNKEEARSYFETLESMHVSMTEAITVGPTDSSGKSWVVQASLDIDRVFQDDPRGTGEIICLGNDGTFLVDPQVKVGDHLENLRGTLDYQLGEYCLQLFTAPSIFPENQYLQNMIAEGKISNNTFTTHIATFNLSNLFDTIDDPGTNDTVLSASEYQRRLQKRASAIHETLNEPELIAIQETENEGVLKALVGRPELNSMYGYVWQDGPDRRGLDVALLYRKDRVQIFSYQAYQSCTTLVDGLGPDGNEDVKNPMNSLTCDTNNDGILDGNRLFSRPPLVVHLWICPNSCTDVIISPQDVELWIIINHFKSKVEDSSTQEYTLPRRLAEATYVTHLVDEICQYSPLANIIVLGDLNDFTDSQPLEIIQQAGLSNTLLGIPYLKRYTYNYQGLSQVLDHILVDLQIPLACVEANSFPINADYPVAYMSVAETVLRSSDHDPVMIKLSILENQTFLPLIAR